MIYKEHNPIPHPCFPEIRGKLNTLRYPVFVEPKYDGETAWFIPSDVSHGTNGYLVNDYDTSRTSCPITDYLHDFALLGELHYGEGHAGDLYKLSHNYNSDDLNFTIFDIDMAGTYMQRRETLMKLVIPVPHVRIARVYLVENESELMVMFSKLTEEGYEGIVAKSFDSRLIKGPCGWVKLKLKETAVFVVSLIDPSAERIEVLISQGITCGVKVANKDKSKLKVGDCVEIEYQGKSPHKRLRHPVFIRKK